MLVCRCAGIKYNGGGEGNKHLKSKKNKFVLSIAFATEKKKSQVLMYKLNFKKKKCLIKPAV